MAVVANWFFLAWSSFERYHWEASEEHVLVLEVKPVDVCMTAGDEDRAEVENSLRPVFTPVSSVDDGSFPNLS